MTDNDAGASRRRVLARAGGSLAATLATSGCLGSGWNPLAEEDGMRVRARAATGTETDTRCRLSADFVDAHPALKRVLTQAADRGSDEWASTQVSDEWASTQVSIETGESLGDALHRHCEGQTRGIYKYRGDWYFVSLRYENPKDHGHPEDGGGGTHEH